MGVCRRDFELLCAGAGLFFRCSPGAGLRLLLLVVRAVFFVRRHANLSRGLEECGPELQSKISRRAYTQ